MNRRGSGLLCHVSSLPSPYGIGDFGPEARAFVDFLSMGAQRYWQILPLTPTDLDHRNSPYESSSAFALSPLFVSPEDLAREGLFGGHAGAGGVDPLPGGPVDYAAVSDLKKRVFSAAIAAAGPTLSADAGFAAFREEHSYWLEDYALYRVLREDHGADWGLWPEALRRREPEALAEVKREREEDLRRVRYEQYLLYRQWEATKAYANRHGVSIIGDVPIYVHYDSADVWAHQELFELDSAGRPTVIAGVPPDDFSKTGQLWGNPIYRWDRLQETGYRWWVERFRHNLRLFDAVRIDHFRGLVAYWEVPAGEKTAVNGRWVRVPTRDFMDRLTRSSPWLPIVVEDLGKITPSVREWIRAYDLPGMKVLLFAFQKHPGVNPYLPHNVPRNCVIYTGTHDNNTVRGWFENEASERTKRRLFRYLGRRVESGQIADALMRLAMMSVADTAIFPVQDILGLGEEGRMNLPASPNDNWRWRLASGAITPRHARRLRSMALTYGRA